jgi:thiol-disulfide isomerase/thioredoxin
MPERHQQTNVRPSRRTALGMVTAPLLAAPLGSALASCDVPQADLRRAFGRDDVWLNTPPLGLSDLAGKVVLVNFWTFTCINSLRPLPYLRTWADRYREQGLVIIGAHTPEFAFEHDLPRVRQAVDRLDVSWPVVLDNEFRIWRGFGNSAWPGFYLLDGEGRLRHRLLGEGEYDDTERRLRSLLGVGVTGSISPVVGQGIEAAPDWADIQSPETYLGYAKSGESGGLSGRRRGEAGPFLSSARLARNDWSLSRGWDVKPEFAQLTGPTGAIRYRFHARDLHLVMAPAPGHPPVRFQVLVDDQPPGSDHGGDTDPQGWGVLDEARLYQLVRQAGPVRDRTFEIRFQSPGPRAFCFTFG